MPKKTSIQQVASFQKGCAVILSFAKKLDNNSGVYRMLDQHNNVLYVGKAARLKNRVMSYTRPNQSSRIEQMIAQTHTMIFEHTESEVDALLLESHLIKTLKPRYNILLKDDTSYPEILIRTMHPYPNIVKHRGKHKDTGKYYGPFDNIISVNQTVRLLQKTFLLRNCTDYFFKTRKRPCLQYQIKRCSAPCVGSITKMDYQKNVKQAVDFLTGQQKKILTLLENKMNQYATQLQYEKALSVRNQITYLNRIYTGNKPYMNFSGDLDIFIFLPQGNQIYQNVFVIRGGLHFGKITSSFPQIPFFEKSLDTLILNWYDSRAVPGNIFLNIKPDNTFLLKQALTEKRGKIVSLIIPQKGQKKEMVHWAYDLSKRDLLAKNNRETTDSLLLQRLQNICHLPQLPTRIEAYDNSHLMGSEPSGAMVTYTLEDGMKRSDYRKFTIKNTAIAMDDFSMMKEVLNRRLSHPEDPPLPDIMLIDGGKGQLNAVLHILSKYPEFTIYPIGVAKGEERNKGKERLFLPNVKDPIILPSHDPLLYLIQRIRDEVHRFVITFHRKKRSKHMTQSKLDEIKGIGPKRKQLLLLYLGSEREVSVAGLKKLQSVPSISKELAQTIYKFYHQIH